MTSAPSDTSIQPKRKRGFAAMDPDAQKRIASLGGQALDPSQRSFSKDSSLAATAGRKGGRAVKDENRAFSRDPKLAASAGRKGGRARQKTPESAE